MNQTNPIRVMLVDDHALVLEGLEARLESEEGIQVIGSAQNGQEALEKAEALNPDVVLMDISMPVLSGLKATPLFRSQLPHIKVLILSMHENREYILDAVQSGASGYLLKEVSSKEMVKAIEAVHLGGTCFSSGASQALFSARVPERGAEVPPPADDSPTSAHQTLTQRETTVLALVAEGRCNKDIARELDISVRTVETHRLNIKQKLNISSAAGLTRYAIEHGLLKL